MTETYWDWHEKLHFALFGYGTLIRSSTRATLFSLVYGMETVLSIEIEIPSRIFMETKLDGAEWVQAQSDQLNFTKKKKKEDDRSMSQPTLPKTDSLGLW